MKNKVAVFLLIICCTLLISCKNKDGDISKDIENEDSKTPSKSEMNIDREFEDLGMLEGTYSMELESKAKLILMISNQSFYMESVDLSIYIDDTLLVNNTYYVEDQHKFLYYYVVIDDGKHDIKVVQNDEVIGDETIEISENPKFIAITFWKDKDTDSSIDFYISDESIGIR